MRRVVLLVALAAVLAVVGWSSWTARAAMVDRSPAASSVAADARGDDGADSLAAIASTDVATPLGYAAPTSPVPQHRARLVVALAAALLLALLALGPRATAWVVGREGRALPRRSSPLVVAPRRGPPARAARLLFV